MNTAFQYLLLSSRIACCQFALGNGMEEVVGSSQDLPPMPKGVRLIRYEKRDPPVRLSEYAKVPDVNNFIDTTLRQLDARLRGETWLAGNWTLSELIARLEAVGCYVALEDPRLALQ